MSLETVSSWACFGGTLSVHDHDSTACHTRMRFGVFVPPQAKQGPCPVLWYLSGLTCTWANVMEKSGIQRMAAELGLIIVAPDTSPRGEGVPDEDSYDFAQGAGFYLDATQAPWNEHFRMESYIMDELPGVIAKHFPADMSRQSVFGHSMGGHGALTLALRHRDRFKSVSAFAPIVAPSRVPWGEKAFSGYLGDDRAAWTRHDACELIKEGPLETPILIDQGEADQFLDRELKPDLFEEACRGAGQSLTLRRHPGYDHSYYFIASFMDDHLAHHAKYLL